jgi:hypothetical protein
LTLSVFFVSCRDKELEKTYTISGIIYEDCSMTPLKNTNLEVTFSFGEGKLLNTPKTDSNGKFVIQYNNYKSRTLGAGVEEIAIYAPNEYQMKRGIPPRKDINMIIYKKNLATLTVNFKLNNILPSDTLYYSMASSDAQIKTNLVESFSETITSLRVVQNDYNDTLGTSVAFVYGIGSQDYKKAVNSGASGQTPYQLRRDIKIKGCGYFDTINIVR